LHAKIGERKISNVQDKNKWHRCATALLGRIARALEIPTNERAIRSNKGGPAIGGEVTMSAPKFGVYVHLHCPWNAYGEEDRVGGNYARKATESDPYGGGMDKPNHSFQYTTAEALTSMLASIAAK
jgi:hypothetical protein